MLPPPASAPLRLTNSCTISSVVTPHLSMSCGRAQQGALAKGRRKEQHLIGTGPELSASSKRAQQR